MKTLGKEIAAVCVLGSSLSAQPGTSGHLSGAVPVDDLVCDVHLRLSIYSLAVCKSSIVLLNVRAVGSRLVAYR